MAAKVVAKIHPLVVQVDMPKPVVFLVQVVTPAPLAVTVALKTPVVVLV